MCLCNAAYTQLMISSYAFRAGRTLNIPNRQLETQHSQVSGRLAA